jgi:dTDP-4-dehydrorhamnose reductase
MTARRVNVEAPVALAKALMARGGRFIFLSSGAVFGRDGERPLAEEITGPRSVYGTLKAEAEKELRQLGPGGTIVRFGKVLTPQFALFNRWIAILARHGQVEAFLDHMVAPIAIDDAVSSIAALIDHNGIGLYQISAAHDISYADAARHFAQRLNVPEDRVMPLRAAQAGVADEEICTYAALDTSRLSALTGFVPPAPTDVIDTVFAEQISAAQKSREPLL